MGLTINLPACSHCGRPTANRTCACGRRRPVDNARDDIIDVPGVIETIINEHDKSDGLGGTGGDTTRERARRNAPMRRAGRSDSAGEPQREPGQWSVGDDEELLDNPNPIEQLAREARVRVAAAAKKGFRHTRDSEPHEDDEDFDVAKENYRRLALNADLLPDPPPLFG